MPRTGDDQTQDVANDDRSETMKNELQTFIDFMLDNVEIDIHAIADVVQSQQDGTDTPTQKALTVFMDAFEDQFPSDEE